MFTKILAIWSLWSSPVYYRLGEDICVKYQYGRWYHYNALSGGFTRIKSKYFASNNSDVIPMSLPEAAKRFTGIKEIQNELS